MDTREAIREMLTASGVSARHASLTAGRSANVLINALNVNKKDIGAGAIAAYADACGYVLALMPAGEVPAGGFVIDPLAPDSNRVNAAKAARQAERDRANTWSAVVARQQAVWAAAESRESRES